MSMPPGQVELSVLVVNFQTRELVLECLRSLLDETLKTSMEVLVWDNASEDQSAQAIAQSFPQVDLVASTENIGFGAANNRLAERAKGDLLLLLNPDTVVLEGAVDRLVEFARERPAARMWGGRTLFPDRSLNPTSCWAAPTLWSNLCLAVGLNRLLPNSALFNHEGMGGWSRDCVREVDMVSGCFLLIETSLWKTLEGFHPAFWMYAEDADLCMRARREGARPAINPAATIVHHGGASEGVHADKIVRLFRAKAQLFRLHWSPWRARIGLALLDFYAFNRVVGLFILSVLPGSSHARGFGEWKRIWSRRGEWRQAFHGARDSQVR